jgi:hypothetical protein
MATPKTERICTAVNDAIDNLYDHETTARFAEFCKDTRGMVVGLLFTKETSDFMGCVPSCFPVVRDLEVHILDTAGQLVTASDYVYENSYVTPGTHGTSQRCAAPGHAVFSSTIGYRFDLNNERYTIAGAGFAPGVVGMDYTQAHDGQRYIFGHNLNVYLRHDRVGVTDELLDYIGCATKMLYANALTHNKRDFMKMRVNRLLDQNNTLEPVIRAYPPIMSLLPSRVRERIEEGKSAKPRKLPVTEFDPQLADLTTRIASFKIRNIDIRKE